MEKFSDYIPLMIIVASVLFSILKGVKKKEEPVSGKTVLPGNIGREDKPIQTSRPVFFPPIEEKKENERKVKKRFFEEKKKLQPLVIEDTQPQLKVRNQSEEPADIPETPFLDLSDTDELKRAVIYAEIFQKKEY